MTDDPAVLGSAVRAAADLFGGDPIPAMFVGWCPACMEDVRVGQLIIPLALTGGANMWVHLVCPTPAPTDYDAPAATPLCQSCWTYHRGDCL